MPAQVLPAQISAIEGEGLHHADGFIVVHNYAAQESRAYREGVELVEDGSEHAYGIYKRIADWLIDHEDE